ncbi:MAG: single-stranded DNA-binding protein [Coleofasciculaceae cyanobacterium]
MNSCVLMAQIIQDPELRYTSDNQTPIAQMLVQFDSLRAEEPPATLKVVGWGNFASEIKENYAAGDQIVIEGSLKMNVIERPEGFKEKRAELIASRIHKLGSESSLQPQVPASSTTFSTQTPVSTTQKPSNVVPLRSSTPSQPKPEYSDLDLEASNFEETRVGNAGSSGPETEQDLDDIPF